LSLAEESDFAMTSAPPIVLPDEFNAAAYFIDRHITEGRGAKVAIECGDIQVSYRQLFERVNRLGNGLRSLGVRIEERVFLLLLDTPEFAVSFFGAIKIGAVPIPVNPLLKPSDYAYLLNNSRARVAIVSHYSLSSRPFQSIGCATSRPSLWSVLGRWRAWSPLRN
jgi:benzoate-CoA ligase